MKHIKTVVKGSLKTGKEKTGCGECQTSCQSACKTSLRWPTKVRTSRGDNNGRHIVAENAASGARRCRLFYFKF